MIVVNKQGDEFLGGIIDVLYRSLGTKAEKVVHELREMVKTEEQYLKELEETDNEDEEEKEGE